MKGRRAKKDLYCALLSSRALSDASFSPSAGHTTDLVGRWRPCVINKHVLSLIVINAVCCTQLLAPIVEFL